MGLGQLALESRNRLDSVHVRITLFSQGQQGKQLAKVLTIQHYLIGHPGMLLVTTGNGHWR